MVMSSHRYLFYCEDATASSPSVTLTGGEHHHFARALRFKAGQTLFVTNGCGLILEGRAATVGRSSTEVDVTSVVEDTPPRREIVLALATIRKDKFEQAFEHCVELGITRCVPFLSQNSHSKRYTSRDLDRLHKIAVAAIKQSFRSHLPHICEPVAFRDLVRITRSFPHAIVGQQGAAQARRPPAGEDVVVVVGPEAGLSGQEIESLTAAGAVPAAVSSHRLRSETAAVALVGAVCGGD
jgi:16S rRNA (uracil1498-N3)-methyltransferase